MEGELAADLLSFMVSGRRLQHRKHLSEFSSSHRYTCACGLCVCAAPGCGSIAAVGHAGPARDGENHSMAL